MEERQFMDYDKISDTLMFFNDSIVLEFVVKLSSKDKNGNRLFFHSECDYDSNQYIGIDKGHSIKRRMTFYYSINDRKNYRAFIIKPEDAIMLRMLIEGQIFPWYFDPKRKIFSIIEGQLKITGKYQDILFARSEYAWLRFQPCVYRFEDNTYKEGIRIYVCSEDTFVDMEIDRFMGLYYYITQVDMYSVASTLALYAKVPPYGVNQFSMSGLGGSYKNQIDMRNNFLPDDGYMQIDTRTKEMNDFFNRTGKEKNKKKSKDENDNDSEE